MTHRIILAAILVVSCLSVSGQTAQEYLKSGIEKHERHDLNGAIKDYDKAISLDKNLKTAFFNRGTCLLALRDFKSAKKDFDRTIELDPKFVKAYYSRASVYISLEKYEESLSDLDKTIELDVRTPHALTLRGQIRAQTGNKKGACEDFNKAREAGDSEADKYLNQYCGNEQQGGESLVLVWPESENWKLASNQENEQMILLELIPTNETLENWTEMGTMTSYKGVKNLPMDKAMNLMYEQSKRGAPQAKLTFIEKDDTAEYPWIIFTIESPNFVDDPRPESQLWYIVQGKTSLYSNFRAIKKATVPQDLKTKWIAFFKTGKVVYK